MQTLKLKDATVTSVAASASNVTLLSINIKREAASIFNDSTNNLYLKFGQTASTNSYTIKMEAGSFYELSTPCYCGVIDGIWDGTNGAARVTEMS